MRRPGPRTVRWGLVAAVIAGSGWTAVTRDDPRTAPPPVAADHGFASPADPDAPAVVWAVGDGADGSAAARAVAQRIAADRPARLLYLGDVYPRGSAEDFNLGFAGVYGDLAAITAPTPGNHDWPTHREGYDPYWRARTGAATPPWYAFRVGGWRIISLNSEAPHDEGSTQVRWLRAGMANDAGTCTLAFWHRPLQSAGRHGDQGDVAPLWNALRGRATLVLNGHDHDSQRLRPRDGVTQLVAGAGGKSTRDVDEDDPRVAFADDRRDAALRIELRPGSARLRFVSAQGEILDRSDVSCRTR